MTETIAQVKQRLSTIDQLDDVMQAMKGISASHLRDAQKQLPGIQAYSQTISLGIGQALSLLHDKRIRHSMNENDSSSNVPDTGKTPTLDARHRTVILVLCAEQGFVGPFNERILDELVNLDDEAPSCSQYDPSASGVLLVGTRGLLAAELRGVTVESHFSMATSVEAVAPLAIKLSEKLFLMIAQMGFSEAKLIYPELNETGQSRIVKRSLIPFDYSRFPESSQNLLPLISMEPGKLVEHLAEEYVFAQICEALMCTYAAENGARVQAMIRARSNVLDTHDILNAHYQQLRQEQITAEITELSLGRLASQNPLF